MLAILSCGPLLPTCTKARSAAPQQGRESPSVHLAILDVAEAKLPFQLGRRQGLPGRLSLLRS